METSIATHEVPNRATSSPVKLEHETAATIHTNSAAPAVTKITLHPSDKKLSPSSYTNSSSPDSPLDDPFHSDNYDDDHKSTSSTSSSSSSSSSPKHKHNTNPNSSNQLSQIEAPATQAMDRSSPYRIPSSVFVRSQSTTPMEWSAASNESLFSIHTGNVSFRNGSSFRQSGELGGGGAVVAPASDRMFSYEHQPTTGPASDMRSRELGLAEATMKEVIKESELGRDYETSLAAVVRGCRRSHGSDTSTTSFAFSLMAGEREKGAPVSTPSSVRSSQEQTHNHPQSQKTEVAQPPAFHDQPKTPAAKENPPPQFKWFSCFTCFSCGAS